MIADFIDLLNSDSELTTLVGANKAFPVRAPQTTPKPYLVVRRKSVSPLEMKGSTSELDTPMIDAAVYADSYNKAEEISIRLREICDGHQDDIFRIMWFVSVEDLFDPNDGNEGSVVMVNTYRAKVINSI
jgi:hypothetical protein